LRDHVPLIEHDDARVSVMITSMMCSTMTSVTPVLVVWLQASAIRLLQLGPGVSPASASSSSHQAAVRSRARARSSSRMRPGRAREIGARSSAVPSGPTEIGALCSAWARAPRCGADGRRNAPTITFVEHRHVLERRRHLKVRPMPSPRMFFGGARVTSTLSNTMRGLVSARVAGKAIEEGRFAGAVRADQAR
jgi:hypothetical protein